MNSKKITGQQIRMARVALKWRVDDLSKYSELPWARLQKFERTDDFLPNDAKTDKLINLFEKNNIQYGFHYPKSINQIDSLKKKFKNYKFVNSENLAKKCFSIPIDPTLSKKEIIKIVKVLNLL